MARLPFKTLAFAAFIICGLFILYSHYQDTYSQILTSIRDKAQSLTKAEASIPNHVHYVFILEDPKADFPLKFYHYLSVYAAWYYMRPDRIYLSTNARDDQISRARDGSSGKWAKLIMAMPGLTINHVEVRTHADNGIEINHVAHKSDFARAQAVGEFGGLYIDFDVFALRDVKVLRESGFNAIAGREVYGKINDGVFLSKKNSKMVRNWAEQMPKVYDQGWTTHSNILLTTIGERLVAEPGEMLVMDREAFAPYSWEANDIAALLEVHQDIPSNLENISNGDPLPSDKDDHPPWARDWHKTYLLHAFQVEDAERHLTPRSILERRSNFARALYPVAKSMYEDGLITIDES